MYSVNNGEHLLESGCDQIAPDPEDRFVWAFFHPFHRIQLRLGFPLKSHMDDTVLLETIQKHVQRSVIDLFAAADYHGPFAQMTYILHVMAGQEYGHAPLLVDLPEELTDLLLGDGIQAYGGFVQEQDLGL